MRQLNDLSVKDRWGTASFSSNLARKIWRLRGNRETRESLAEEKKTAKPLKTQDFPTKLKSFVEAAVSGDIVVLAVAGDAALEALHQAGAGALKGKTVIDACNPIGGGPPVNGVLSLFTNLKDSLMERMQKAYPDAHFVKAFNSVGSAQMVNPRFAGGRPTMFICGDDASAKKTVTGICDQFGWDVEDMGAVEAARAIEPLCMLWCIPGVGKGDWSPHAFKLLR